MKPRQRSFPLDCLSIVHGDKSIIIRTHGSDIELTAWEHGKTREVKLSPNQLFEMISKMKEEKEV